MSDGRFVEGIWRGLITLCLGDKRSRVEGATSLTYLGAIRCAPRDNHCRPLPSIAYRCVRGRAAQCSQKGVSFAIFRNRRVALLVAWPGLARAERFRVSSNPGGGFGGGGRHAEGARRENEPRLTQPAPLANCCSHRGWLGTEPRCRCAFSLGVPCLLRAGQPCAVCAMCQACQGRVGPALLVLAGKIKTSSLAAL